MEQVSSDQFGLYNGHEHIKFHPNTLLNCMKLLLIVETSVKVVGGPHNGCRQHDTKVGNLSRKSFSYR